MMKKNKFFILNLIIISLICGELGFAAQKRKAIVKKAAARRQAVTRRAPVVQPPRTFTDDSQLRRALQLASQKNYEAASIMLFSLARNPKYFEERSRIKYILGLMFQEMKMYQVAAFQFVDVIRSNKAPFTRQALQKLSIAADELNDDTLLNYAIGKINVGEFPKANQDMLRFRIGEYLMRKNKYDQAAESFAKVQVASPYYPKAKYMEGLAHTKSNDLGAAMRSFSTLAQNRASSGITDVDRVAAIAGMARVAYQQKKWDLSIDLYRQIPKDTEIWHDALFEESWAYMRSARFRSVLSNLHSLHSPYYEDFYLPESILLRGIVYLYICQYDEMEKTLGMFEKIYGPVQYSLEQYTSAHHEPTFYFQDIEKMIKNFEELKTNPDSRKNYKLPFLVVRDIIREGDFKHTYSYISSLRQEASIIDNRSHTWKRAAIGVYAKQIIRGRLGAAQKTAGQIARNHMVNMKNELVDLFEQYNFAKYEMINGKKETLKKKIQGKGLKSAQVDDSKNRDFYIQNGFEYWPFYGEYWLDEIGDYYYVGTQGCE